MIFYRMQQKNILVYGSYLIDKIDLSNKIPENSGPS